MYEYLLANSGGAMCVGGPAFVMWVSPTDEELFQKYSPELKKKSLERRYERQKEFDDFVGKLKEYSKSDKPSEFPALQQTLGYADMFTVWFEQKEAQRREKEAKIQEGLKIAEEVKARKEEMRKAAGLPVNSDT
jgi:pyruvate/2-oxoacid:ferredoxin oxidoreductase beta subunit